MAGYAASDPAAQMEGAFSDKILNRLARKVGDEWQDIGVELDFTMADIQQIRADVPQQEKHLVAVTFAIFRKWRSRNDHLSDEEKYNMLRRAFQEVEKQSLVHQLDQLVDISSIKEAGNKQVRLEREVETMRQELEALKSQSGLQSHQQNEHYKQQVGQLQKQLQEATVNKQHQQDQQHQQPSAIQDKTVKSKQAPLSCISLHTLLASTYKSVKVVTPSSYSWSLKLVRGELWTLQEDGITIYDLQLDTKRRLKCEGIGEIHGVAELEESVVFAAKEGLFTASFHGENKKKFESGQFTDVCYANGSVYAARYDDSHIHVFNPIDGTRTSIIKTGCSSGDWHNLVVTSNHIIMGCGPNDCIYYLDASGQRVRTHGRRGELAGGFKSPIVCQSDSNNALLVADCTNDRLQLLNEDKWHVLELQPEPEKPKRAVYVNCALYVVSGSYCGPFKLTKYEPTR